MDMPVTTSYVPKGDGGYDFWFEGKQVSLKDYITELANMYNMSITQVEQSAWMPPGSSVAEDAGTGDWYLAGAPTTVGGETTSREPVAPGGGGGDTFQPITYDDGTGPRIYTTPEDYSAAVMRKVNKDYNDSVTQIENNFKNGFITIDERDAEIKRTRQSLNDKKTSDLQSVAGYMNSISPDAIQSGQATLENKAVKDYTQNTQQLGSELGSNLYDANGKIRQDLTPTDLAPYMQENSDTGNLARAIAGNYTNKTQNLEAATTNLNAGVTQSANDYIGSQGPAALSNYSNFLQGSIINNAQKPGQTPVKVSSGKVDRYGNPIEDWTNK